ncbi:hypothetical protein ACFRMN_36185 [Streptomyces sp. NPDC056835]|uniref:tetratricopeptide repeat protein n=1 Tax=Streptomyces sp. NPDC056835 TaxID=3345956 RepID=UPI003697635D
MVWLNEAQHYLGAPLVGEQIAAAVHSLLTDPSREPILVLGTLWSEYANQYTAMPAPGEPDPHSRVRELLAGRILAIPDAFDQQALCMAADLAQGGDRLLADALTRAGNDGRVPQGLAGSPELLRRYAHSSPASKAVLEAAMDARRLGMSLQLPQAWLIDAAIDYLGDQDYDQLTEGWAEEVFADLARPVHGKQALLRRVAARPKHLPPGSVAWAPAPVPDTGQTFRLADYLEQHGRTTRRAKCPPASFWHSAHRHLRNADDLYNLAAAAKQRYRLQWAHHLRNQAANAGSTRALVDLAREREAAEDHDGAHVLYRQAAEAGDTGALLYLAREREAAGDYEGAEALYHRAIGVGSTDAMVQLMRMREADGDRDGAEALAQQTVDAGSAKGLVYLALMREKAGDYDGAEALAEQAVGAGSTRALVDLAREREAAGDYDGAEALYQRAIGAGSTDAMVQLMKVREEAGDSDGADALAQRAANAGNADGLLQLALIRGWDRAETLYRQAVEAGSTEAVVRLAMMRELEGDPDEAETLYQRVVEIGDADALALLAVIKERVGDHDGADAVAERAVEAGSTGLLGVLSQLAWEREEAGDLDGAEALYRKAVESGDSGALFDLALEREQAGDRGSAGALYRQAADVGDGRVDAIGPRWWPNGLDPDGTPTPRW